MNNLKKMCSVFCLLVFILSLAYIPTVGAADEPAIAAVTKTVNVAKGRPVTVNGASFGTGENLVNDVLSTSDYWICYAGAAAANPETGAQASQAEAIIDLGRKYKPEKIVIFDRQGTIATDRDFFVVLGSNDPTFATSVTLFEMGSDTSAFPQNKEITITPEDDEYYRYIKYKRTVTYRATQLAEIQVWADVTATEISRSATVYSTPVQGQVLGQGNTGTYGAERLVDGSLDTAWMGAYYNSTTYLGGTAIQAYATATIDLGTAKNVGLVELNTATTSNAANGGSFYLYGSDSAVTANEMSDIVDSTASTTKRYFDLTHEEWTALSDYNYNTLWNWAAAPYTYTMTDGSTYNPFPTKDIGSFALTLDETKAYRYYTYRRSRTDLFGHLSEFTLYEINPIVYKVDSTNVISGEVILYFTDTMNKETLNSTNIKLYDAEGNAVSYSDYTVYDDYYVIRNDFSGEGYTVEITDGVKNTLGVSAASTRYTFDGLESNADIYAGLSYKTDLYNVAANKPATTHSASLSGAPAFDNDRGTQGANRVTLYPNDNAYIQVDLLRKYVIEQIEVNGAHSAGLATTDAIRAGRKNFKILASNDPTFAEENTVTLYTQGSEEFTADEPLIRDVDTDGKAYRYVRYAKTANESSLITEIKIYAKQTMTEVANGKPTVASHAISLTYPANRGHYSAERMVDGNNAENIEAWLAYDPYVPFFRVDLERPYPIGAIEIEAAYGGDNRAGRIYWDVLGSNSIIENEFETLTSTDVAASKTQLLENGYTELGSADYPYPNVTVNGIEDFMSPVPPLSAGYAKWSIDDTNSYRHVTLKKNVNVRSASLGEIRVFVVNPVVNEVSMENGIITVDFSDVLKAKTVNAENITVKKNGVTVEADLALTADGYGFTVTDESASADDEYELTISRMIRNTKNVTMAEDYTVKVIYDGINGEVAESYNEDGNLAYMHPVTSTGQEDGTIKTSVTDGDCDTYAKASGEAPSYQIDLKNVYDLSSVVVAFRTDEDVPAESANVSVYVTEAPDISEADPVIKTDSDGLALSEELKVTFDSVKNGRYITVTGESGSAISIAEIYAYAKGNSLFPQLKAVSVNKDVTRVDVITDATVPKTADLYLAVYDGGRLKNMVKQGSISLERNSKVQSVTVDSYIPYDGGEIKAFLWSDGLIPLSENTVSADELFTEEFFAKTPDYDFIADDTDGTYSAYAGLDPASRGDTNYQNIKAVFYEGPTYQGNPTKVFAYLGIPETASESNKVPAVVLLHGGGGTATLAWVQKWVDHGYAAISMDLNGTVPSSYAGWGSTNNVLGAYSENSLKHEWAGRKAGTQDVDLAYPEGDSWPGQATQTAVLANNLLRSLPEIDSSRIGVSGISWGGYLTSIVMGIDNRFAFANPIYGCGYLDLSNTYFYSLKIDDGAGDYHWDAKYFIKKAEMPIIWVNSDHDGNFDITAFSRSFEDSPAGSVMSIHPDLGHSMSSGATVEAVYAFADSIVCGGEGFISVSDVVFSGTTASVAYELPENVTLSKAELYYNTDDELPYNGKYASGDVVAWSVVEPTVIGDGNVQFEVPAAAKRFYINLTDDNGYISSSKLVNVE